MRGNQVTRWRIAVESAAIDAQISDSRSNLIGGGGSPLARLQSKNDQQSRIRNPRGSGRVGYCIYVEALFSCGRPGGLRNISTCKLIIETAKFNVITAYSGAEAIESVQRFPALDGIVIDAGLRDRPAGEIVRELKRLQPKLPIVVICTPGADDCPEAEYRLEFLILRGYSNCCRASVPRRLLPFGRAIRNSAKKKKNSRGSIEPGLPKRPTASSRPAEARRISCRTARTPEHPSLVRSIPRLRGRTLPFFPPE